MAETRILVVGSTMIDLVTYAKRLPRPGETVVGSTFQIGFGGKGANQAVAAARLGSEVAIVNTIGDDNYGDQYLANFAAERIDTTYVRRVPGSSGVAPIWVDEAGMNSIIIVPGANLHVSAELAAEAVEDFSPSVVIGQFEIPQAVTTAAFAAARAKGITTILNPAPAAKADARLLALTDWLVPNEHEFAAAGGGALHGSDADEDETLDAAAAKLGISIALTLGDRGAALRPVKGVVARIPAVPARAVDTTGAGDAFVGAFAVGLAMGWQAGPAAQLGCAFAAASVTRAGTQSSFPDRKTAASILASVEV